MLLGQKREYARELAKGRAFNPGHKGDEVVLSPFPRHLEDRRQGRLAAKVRTSQAVSSQDSLTCFLEVPNFGDVSSEVFLR